MLANLTALNPQISTYTRLEHIRLRAFLKAPDPMPLDPDLAYLFLIFEKTTQRLTNLNTPNMASNSGPLPPIRVDDITGFLCLSDIYEQFDEGAFIFRNWLSDCNTILFFRAWESINDPSFDTTGFEEILCEAGRNAFRLTTTRLENAGATGIFVQQSLKTAIYAHPDWAMHFGNWLSPTFYVDSLAVLRMGGGPEQNIGFLAKAMERAVIDLKEEE